MIPRLSPSFDLADLRALVAGPGDGQDVAAFEQALAAYSGRRHALVFPMGRSGLYALIKVMAWRDREIVLPAYTCAVVANTVLATGNRPRFVDIELGDLNMRPQGVADALSPDTAAVLATHLYGFPMDLDGLARAIGDRDDVVVIHDCALALGARYQGRPVWRDGLAALFSFSIGKHMSSVEGGAMVMDDPALYREMRDFRDRNFRPPALSRTLSQAALFVAAWLGLTPFVYPLVHRLTSRTRLLDFLTKYYAEDRVVMPPHLLEMMPAGLARLGLAQLGRVEKLIERRVEAARFFVRNGAAGLTWPRPRDGASYSHCPCLVEDRARFESFMARRGIHVGKEVFDYSLPEMPLFATAGTSDYPNARRAARQIALIPNHPRLRERDRVRIAEALTDWGRG